MRARDAAGRRRREGGRPVKARYLDVPPKTKTTSRECSSGCNIRSTFENNSEVVNHESLAGAVKFLRNWSTAFSPRRGGCYPEVALNGWLPPELQPRPRPDSHNRASVINTVIVKKEFEIE